MSGPDYSCKPERALTKDEVRAELARIHGGEGGSSFCA